MRNIQKIKFSDIIGMLENDEMREITGGYGETYACGSYAGPSTGGGSYNPDSILAGFGGGTAIGSTIGGVPYNSNTSSSNNGIATGGGSNYGSSSYTAGWTYSNGNMNTNDPATISRFFDFVNFNSSLPARDQMNINTFLVNESTVAGQQQNSLFLYNTIELKNVNVANNYKGPSTIPQGAIYNNGVLQISNSVYYGGGTLGNGGNISVDKGSTPAILTAFTKEQVIKYLEEIKFSDMYLNSVIDYDPIKKEHNYSKTFDPVMKLNSEGAFSIALFENLSLTVYDMDGSASGNATIGFGHKLHNGKIIATDVASITLKQSVMFLATDMVVIQGDLNQKIENMDLTGKFDRNQYFALVDMAFNAGIGSEKNQTITHQVLTAMQSGGVNAANNVIMNAYINESNGGLKDRRYFEAEAFVNGRSITPDQANAELIKLGLKK